MHFLKKEDALEFVRARSSLFDEAGHANPFSCSVWVLNLIEQVAQADWTVVIPEYVGDGESVMLLYSEARLPHRRSALTNYYASLYSPLISSARDRTRALRELVDQLVHLRPRCSVIGFAPLDEDCADTASLRRLFLQQGWYVKKYFSFGNWYLPCAGLSFEKYMGERTPQLYNTWVRKSRKFHAAARARLEIVTDPAGMDAAMDAYDRVFAKSWKKPEPYRDFVRNWARICAEHGWLRLGLAWVDDVPIAAQFWFTMQHRAYIFKLAYDEEYSKWSAGTVLTAHMIEHSLERDRVVEIDYLTGDDPYKQSWMTARRERIGLLACDPWTPRGLTTAALEYAGELRQRWRRRRRQPAESVIAGTSC